jgi:hypothetical protein
VVEAAQHITEERQDQEALVVEALETPAVLQEHLVCQIQAVVVAALLVMEQQLAALAAPASSS